MNMDASQAMTGWAGDAHPPFRRGRADASPGLAAEQQAGGSAEERFEMEAMPHLNDLFRTALRMTGDRGKWFRFPLLKENAEFLEANLVQPAAVGQEITDGEILAALDQIPSDFRSVVLLVDVEEFAYKEVAEILSIPIGTVMSRLSRGRGLLRKHLAGLARAYGIGKTLPKDNSLRPTQNLAIRRARS